MNQSDIMKQSEIMSFIEDDPETKGDDSLCQRALRKKWKCLIIYAFVLIAVCQIIERVDFNTIDLNFDNIKKFQETT